jgi:hypothetical protein
MLCLGQTKSGINVFVPRNGHRVLLENDLSATDYWMFCDDGWSLFCFFLQAS